MKAKIQCPNCGHLHQVAAMGSIVAHIDSNKHNIELQNQTLNLWPESPAFCPNCAFKGELRHFDLTTLGQNLIEPPLIVRGSDTRH